MSRQPPAAAAEALVAAVRARGRVLNARQIERWRQAGVPLESDRRWLGRDRGSESAYPPESVDRAVLVLDLLDERRDLDYVVVEMFMRGIDPHEAALKDAYANQIDAVRRQLEKVAPMADAFDRAEVIARALLKRGKHPLPSSWRDRVRRMKTRLREERLERQREANARGLEVTYPKHDYERERAGTLLLSAVTNLVMLMLTGEPVSDEAHTEFVEASGVGAGTREHFDGSPPPVTDVTPDKQVFKLVRLDALARGIYRTSMQELRQAREDIFAIFEFAHVFAPFVRETTSLHEAFGLVAFTELVDRLNLGLMLMPTVVLRHAFPQQADATFTLMREVTPGFGVALKWVRELPPRFRPYLGPNRSADELPAADREHLYSLIRDIAARNPDDVPIIHHLSEITQDDSAASRFELNS